MKQTDHTWESDKVLAALLRLGGHSKVPISVAAVTEEDGSPVVITIDVKLEYRSATPVCCPEPGCYVPFLGTRRHQVPSAVQDALSLLDRPRVVIRALLDYEPGYEHISFPGLGKTCVITYDADTFAAA